MDVTSGCDSRDVRSRIETGRFAHTGHTSDGGLTFGEMGQRGVRMEDHSSLLRQIWSQENSFDFHPAFLGHLGAAKHIVSPQPPRLELNIPKAMQAEAQQFIDQARNGGEVGRGCLLR